MNISTRLALFALTTALAAACGSNIDVGQNDGGSGGDDAGAGDDGSGTTLSDAATSSPNFAKCKVTCAAPTDGPCKSADVNACIEKCTALTDGLSAACVQCIVENSEYTGTQCVPSSCGKTCPDVKCDWPNCSMAGCGGTAGSTVTCDPACTESDVKCDGMTFAKSTSSACADACK